MSSSIHANPPPPIVSEPTGINYATGPALGKGGFAICHRAERYNGSTPTGHVVALKIVRTKMEPAKLAQKFVTELQIHSKLSHPNIVTFYRAFSFQTSTYVVLELCSNGSLADLLKRRKYLTLPEIRRLMIQVCGAVKYLHHRHIVHRDLKTGNLFLDDNMNIKVGDFGLAALLVTEREMEVRRRTTMCGTPNYLAPEILEKGKGHDEKVDLWAIGIIAYTLAVGKAPFHASTKEEIYKKLRSGTYTWPELSATTNQSSDLRDLVSSLLVPEEQRPLPDKIVSHSFFRIAFVPSSIPASAAERAPSWPEVSIPSADTIRRGYSDTWFDLCKISGVGEYEPGRHFPLNGGHKVRSIVHDMAQDAQAGRQPTMPIPTDVVYTSTVNDWNHTTCGQSEGQSTSTESRGLKEVSHNEVASTRPRTAEGPKPISDAELMPPPRAPSRVSRTASVRRAARTISEENAKALNEPVKVAADVPSAQSWSLQPTNTRKPSPSGITVPATAATAMTMKETNLSSKSGYHTAPSHPASDLTADKSQRAGTVKRSADASLARRPRGTRTVKERCTSPVEVQPKSDPAVGATKKDRRQFEPDAPGPLATLDELKEVSPFKYRKKAAASGVIEILSDPESDGKDEHHRVDAQVLHLPPPPAMKRPVPVPTQKTASESDFAIPGTDPTAVLERLALFRDNLAFALRQTHRSSTAAKPAARGLLPANDLPFVSRWVDYSRKHGVGYVLSDGTVGCIINGTTKSSAPVSHVVVRNGQRWLQKVSKDQQQQHRRDMDGLEQVPLEVLEDRGASGIQRKVYKGLGSVKSGSLLADAERRRTLGVLWVKFGRYMCQSTASAASDAAEGDDTAAAKSRGPGNFVRFYQRIGCVGVWVFVDGCMQVHFPDHTKLVLAADGSAASATLLTLDAVAHLSQHGELLPQHVAGRQVLADDLAALLHDGARTVRHRTVRANQLHEKLSFVLDLVTQWAANGGLGRLDEDHHTAAKKLAWEGIGVNDTAAKVDRVTVGKLGGD